MSTTAARAPASVTSLPRGRAVVPIQRLRADSVPPWGRNSVPTGSAANRRSSTSGAALGATSVIAEPRGAGLTFPDGHLDVLRRFKDAMKEVA